MKKYAFAVVLGLSFIAIAFGVGAVAPGDELAPAENTSVYLHPADSFNGNQYVELNGENELEITVDGLPTNSTTTLDTLFFASYSGVAESEDNVKIWFPHTNDDVTVYHNTSDQPIESRASAVRLKPGESIPFGLLIESGGSAPAVETLQIRAITVEPVETPTPTPTPTPPPDDPTPADPTPTPTPTDPTPTPTPTDPTPTPDNWDSQPSPTPTDTPTAAEPDDDDGPLPDIEFNWTFMIGFGLVTGFSIWFLILRVS